jgi:hypothetical protein
MVTIEPWFASDAWVGHGEGIAMVQMELVLWVVAKRMFPWLL